MPSLPVEASTSHVIHVPTDPRDSAFQTLISIGSAVFAQLTAEFLYLTKYSPLGHLYFTTCVKTRLTLD